MDLDARQIAAEHVRRLAGESGLDLTLIDDAPPGTRLWMGVLL